MKTEVFNRACIWPSLHEIYKSVDREIAQVGVMAPAFNPKTQEVETGKFL